MCLADSFSSGNFRCVARLLKRLRKKSNKQIDHERKEHGFSLYVNGANSGQVPPTGGTKVSPSHTSPAKANPRRLKTTGGKGEGGTSVYSGRGPVHLYTVVGGGTSVYSNSENCTILKKLLIE
jgi:hypothetical protein